MEEETPDDHDSREEFPSSDFSMAVEHDKEEKSKSLDDKEIMEGNLLNSVKRGSSVNFSSDGQDSRSSRSNSEHDAKISGDDVNHLNALANLDPNSKFEESASLIKDIRLAANVAAEDEMNKVYMCHLCDFKTAYANSLMNHQAVHSDFRPWACTACEYAAKRKQDLKKHLHTVHGMMVESPMLKPVVPSGSGSKFIGGMDGMKDHFGESLNLKRSSSLDQDFSVLQPSSSSQGVTPTKRIKEEASNMFLSSFSSDQPPDRSSLMGRELDSPDDNLPISFPTLSSSSLKQSEIPGNSESPSLPKFLPGREEGEIVFNGAHPNFSWHLNKRDKFSDSPVSNIPRDWASHRIKKENNFQQILYASKETSHQPMPLNKSHSSRRENSLHRSFSLSDDDTPVNEERSGMVETDRSITSSSLVGHVRSTQTPSGFLCEHCDILFFQRAMYVMHIGLHAPDNPWCCAVCGNTFSEKYSFTSHFINQH